MSKIEVVAWFRVEAAVVNCRTCVFSYGPLLRLSVMLTRMGGGLGIVGFVCLNSSTYFERLVGMWSCLDESRRCNEVGSRGRLVCVVESIVCHLGAMAVARGFRVAEIRVRFWRWSEDSAWRILWK